MQIFQRILLVFTVAVSVMLCCFVVSRDESYKRVEQWEHIRVEEFLQRITKKQEFSTDEYVVFVDTIKYLDNTAKINLEMYRKEWDIKEQGYYFLVLQEEVQKILQMKGTIELEEGTIIKIVVQHKSNRNLYYMVVSGKGDR